MYSQRTNYVLIGCFVISMVIAIIVSLALITGRTGASDTYYVVLDNVADIKYGTQVRYEGFPVGQVEEITPEPDGARMRFRVEVSVQEGWRIPDDSLARIGASTFLSAKTIDIASGESGQITPVGGQIASAAPVDIFSTISTTASEISELNRNSVKPLLESLTSLVQTAEIGAPRITEELITFTERLNATLAPLQEIMSKENLDLVELSIGNVEEATGNMAILSRDLRMSLQTVDHLMTNLDEVIQENKGSVDETLKDARYTLRVVASTVDAIVHNLEGTMRNMNEFSRLIRQNPGLLLDSTPREAVSPAGNRANSGESNGG